VTCDLLTGMLNLTFGLVTEYILGVADMLFHIVDQSKKTALTQVLVVSVGLCFSVDRPHAVPVTSGGLSADTTQNHKLRRLTTNIRM